MQGFNMGRYVPPDLEGTTSLNTASGKGHALGARARKLKSEGILIVRFECPFAIWCTNCQPEQIIGQGVRFNAEKKKMGNYYSTPIWSFRIKHNVCGKSIEVRTDPKNAEYVVVEGGRRRDTGVDKILDGEIRLGATEEERARMEQAGGFSILEKKLEDKKEADTQKRRIDQLTERSERDWSDPYKMSRKLRREFRVGRRQRQADEKSGEALQNKFGLDMTLLAPEQHDAERAAFVDFGEPTVIETSSKPMFADELAVISTQRHRRGERGKQQIPDVDAQKQALQKALKGNTRIALDPFLSSDDSPRGEQWRARVKRHKIDGDEGDNTPLDNGKQVTASMAGSATLVGYESDSS